LTVKYTIEAKPTFYNGVQFRSRLEARWAAYFDIEGWIWHYEPIDFGLWSPDFLLNIEEGSTDWYIEVKPITKPDHETGMKMLRATSMESKLMMLGLNTSRAWYWDDGSGTFKKMPLINCGDEEWKEAGNIVQWLL
jgi:hypothetical protein